MLLFSNSWEDHVEHIRVVLGTLRQAGLTVNPEKCRWEGQYMEFLGHQVGGGRMSMPAHRAQALGNYETQLINIASPCHVLVSCSPLV